jgi:PAS domain-containing protein
MIEDITREKAEHERHDRDQQRTASILASVRDGITVLNAEGELIYANDTAAHLMGFKNADELLRLDLATVMRRFVVMDASGNEVANGQLPSRRALRGETDPEQLLRYT